MRNKINLPPFLCLLCFTLSVSYQASASNVDKLTLDEVEYRYEKIPVYREGSENIAFYKGRVSVHQKNVETYYQVTNLMPGCDGMPALSLLDIEVNISSLLKKTKPNQFVIFCGSTGGPHNTVRIFKPGIGVVASLDFMHGPVVLKSDNSGQLAIVTSEFYLKTLEQKIPYITVYRLHAYSSSISFNPILGHANVEYYELFVRRSYERLRKEGEFAVSSGVGGLLIAMIIGNETLKQKVYEELDYVTEGKAALVVKEIEDKFLINH